MHYYKRNLGDYAKKAGRLSMLQHGSYTLLIDACYDREQFPTLDEAIEWTWASTTEEIEAVTFVLRKFFVLENGIYVQNRIQQEIAEYHGKAETNKRIALEREANRKKNSTNRAPSVDETPPNHKPLTKNHKPVPKEKAPPSALPDWMPIESWAGYLEMRKNRKKVPTDRAVELLIGVLGKMREQGHDIAAVLDTSTKNCWTDVYLPKTDGGTQRGTQGKFNGLNQIDHSSSRQAQERSIAQMGIQLSNDPGDPVEF